MSLREENERKQQQQSESVKLSFNCGDAEKCVRMLCVSMKFLLFRSGKYLGHFSTVNKITAETTAALITINSRLIFVANQ